MPAGNPTKPPEYEKTVEKMRQVTEQKMKKEEKVKKYSYIVIIGLEFWAENIIKKEKRGIKVQDWINMKIIRKLKEAE